MSKTTTQEPTMTTKQKSLKIATDFATLLDQGNSSADSLNIIAKASHTDSETILRAIVYAMAA